MKGGGDFRIIGFTTEEEWFDPLDEACALTQKLDEGVIDVFHVRKTKASKAYTEALLAAIPSDYYGNLVLHSHFSLIESFKLGGIHLKPESEFYVPLMKSCTLDPLFTAGFHSVREFDSRTFGNTGLTVSDLSYSFLSPVFDSISKNGYKSGFSITDREILSLTGRFPVIALGGVTPQKYGDLFRSKFAGAAHLGYLWDSKFTNDEIRDAILKARSALS